MAEPIRQTPRDVRFRRRRTGQFASSRLSLDQCRASGHLDAQLRVLRTESAETWPRWKPAQRRARSGAVAGDEYEIPDLRYRLSRRRPGKSISGRSRAVREIRHDAAVAVRPHGK